MIRINLLLSFFLFFSGNLNTKCQQRENLKGPIVNSETASLFVMAYESPYNQQEKIIVFEESQNVEMDNYGLLNDWQSFIESLDVMLNSAELDGSVKDIEGNVYKIKRIGDQVWMIENLRTTKLRDGTSIPLITDNAQWAETSSMAYCWYNNDESNKNIYGALYNWYAVKTNKLCPSGWHVPTDEDWQILINSLGGSEVAGGKLKETGTDKWMSPNTGATNATEFSALPGGGRNFDGPFGSQGLNGYWWTADEYSETYASNRVLNFNKASISRYASSKKMGFSVRCIRN